MGGAQALRNLVLGFTVCLVAGGAAAQTPAYIGEARCIECHGQENQHFDDSVHAKAFRLNPRTDIERRSCEACHGPGSLHAKNGVDKTLIIGFTKAWGTPVETQNGQCLTCHEGGNRLHWPGSAHMSNKVACADCHNPMRRTSADVSLVRQRITETCFQCHPQERAEFRKRSHMPVLEGKMTCVDCHNPHGSATRSLLKADSVNDVCYACHAEKRGPFIWEHAPVRESCLNCHQPHGSNHDKLLVSARPYLCSQCHNPPVGHPGQFFRDGQTAASALVGGAQSARVIGRSCQNCHTAVHGSNHPAGARFQR
ncbi:MAG: DmsE family decaheme c-type cytochrome [Acidobacteria bacterium]|nr:DmsE family decaheme c-type cytochrome [Acidobacteriota bacterium]